MLADWGLIAFGQLLDRVVDLGQLAGLNDLVEGCVRVGEHQVVIDGPAEEHSLLRHHAKILAQLVGAQITNVPAIENDAPFLGLVETLQQLRKSALPAAGGTHYCHASTGFHGEIKATEQERSVAAIPEADISDIDSSLVLRLPRRDAHVRLARDVHHIAKAAHGDLSLLKLLPQAHHVQHRLGQPVGEHLERNQHADGE